MDSKICFLLSFTAILITISDAGPVASKEFCDSFYNKNYASQKAEAGTPITRMEPTDDLSEPKRLVKRAEETEERGGDSYLDSEGDVVIKTLLNQCERSQGSVIRTLAEDAAMLTTSTSLVRQQSNDAIKKSDVKEVDVVLYAPISLGGRTD
ncbi:uncharacterized protein LOC141857700 [Brevipalpus obovatus]|uniref:uncharacterized protein LOC141857700 n=1 Tax=Brevipalpus obovatus TaxID=246614 RepID=UPI003D9F1499